MIIKRSGKWIWVIFGFILGLFVFVSSVFASIYVEVGDQVYEYLEYLEARGCIKSGILTTYPLSQKEILRLINEAEEVCKGDSYIKEALKKIKNRISYDPVVPFFKPIDEVKVEVGYADSEEVSQRFYNNDGDEFKQGYNLRIGFNTFFSGNRFSAFLKPEYQIDKEASVVNFKKAYGVFSWYNLNFLFGKESQWWGPGRNGSIILSNNAEPFTMIRIENESPIVFPWIGLFKFVFFVTKLNKDRVVPQPYLWGMRINIKPFPYLELGFSRTALLGGEGCSEDLNTWIKSFVGKDEDTPKEPIDQRAGFDIKITIPNRYLSFQTYLEAEGEDENGGIPSYWAYTLGLYLPEIPKLRGLSLRAEYTTTPKEWYMHYIYKSGYTYEGHIIGHHIGRYAKGIWGELSYWILRFNILLKLGYEHTLHQLTDEKENTGYFLINKDFASKISVQTFFQYSNFKNFEGLGENKSLTFVLLRMIYYW